MTMTVARHDAGVRSAQRVRDQTQATDQKHPVVVLWTTTFSDSLQLSETSTRSTRFRQRAAVPNLYCEMRGARRELYHSNAVRSCQTFSKVAQEECDRRND